MEKALGQCISKYADLANEELEIIRPRLEVRELGKREVLLRIGEQEQHLNLVIKGVLRKYFYKGREEVITQLAKEGDLISSSVSFFAAGKSRIGKLRFARRTSDHHSTNVSRRVERRRM